MVPVDDGSDGIAKIAQQVPAVGYSNRLWGALAAPIGVGTRAVAGNDLDPRMLTKPRCECLGLAIR